VLAFSPPVLLHPHKAGRPPTQPLRLPPAGRRPLPVAPPPPESAPPGRWEFLRRRAREGVRSLDTPLHVGLAVLVVGGVFLFDFAHERLWAVRNRGKGFEDAVAAAKQQRAAAQRGASPGPRDGDSGGGRSGSIGRGGAAMAGAGAGAGGCGAGGGADMGGPRSVWLDGMRGRDVGREAGVDKGVPLRASPAGQMRGHPGP
jgi:hypothetical protein